MPRVNFSRWSVSVYTVLRVSSHLNTATGIGSTSTQAANHPALRHCEGEPCHSMRSSVIAVAPCADAGAPRLVHGAEARLQVDVAAGQHQPDALAGEVSGITQHGR